MLLILSRYGISSRKFLRNLRGMVELLNRNNVIGTFPVTATLIKRHPEVVKVLYRMELAVHGYHHKDMSLMSNDSQEHSIKRAISTFRLLGLEPHGFRAPYLGWNEATIDAVARSGLQYDSSIPMVWDIDSGSGHSQVLKNALESYMTLAPGDALPSFRGNIIELMVAIPDDEILIDRMSMESDEELSKIMLHMLDSALSSEALLVLQLHPERFDEFRGALNKLLLVAQSRNVWIAPLGEIATWWKKRAEGTPRWPNGARCAMSVTGDIDAVTLTDFALRVLGR